MPICDGYEACKKIYSLINEEMVFDSFKILSGDMVMSSEEDKLVVKENKFNS